MGGSMMNKMSSKFTQLQKGMGGTSAAAHTGGKAPADWKKWAKRGAIGVAGIGALALGVDAAGDMFSGAEALGGGGDFTGGGFEGGDAAATMDAQTAVDANAAQLGMEQVGQENAVMLTDPVGTECKFCTIFFMLYIVVVGLVAYSKSFHQWHEYPACAFANHPVDTQVISNAEATQGAMGLI